MHGKVLEGLTDKQLPGKARVHSLGVFLSTSPHHSNELHDQAPAL